MAHTVAPKRRFTDPLPLAQSQLADFKDAAERCKSLEKELKEKNLLVGKLRHEGE